MHYVQTAGELAEVAASIEGEKLIAVDTEAAGYHRYRDRVCVVQLSTRQETHVIDALALTELGPLEGILADPDIEVVFHDADYDLRLLSRDFGLGVRGLFDTKLAAQFLGEPAFGLGALVEKYLGITLEKKFQRADWAQRPLPRELLEYAAEDTRHLPGLRDRLHAALIEKNRLHWAEEEFRLAELTQHVQTENGTAFLKLKGARELERRQLAALRELHQLREQIASERDVAPFRVITNDALLEIARTLPRTTDQLIKLKGVPVSLVDRRGSDLLAALDRARALPEAELPSFPRGPRRPPPDPTFEARMDRLRAGRDKIADQLGLDRGFLMPRAQLEEIARTQPKNVEQLRKIGGIREWQVEALGAALLGQLK